LRCAAPGVLEVGGETQVLVACLGGLALRLGQLGLELLSGGIPLAGLGGVAGARRASCEASASRIAASSSALGDRLPPAASSAKPSQPSCWSSSFGFDSRAHDNSRSETSDDM
jgi:hypothetical protein